ncbi:MAG: hypothetical protein E6J92_00285 [Methanobacteriota archaeon]|nr:MAG: hypothetical protein E6J92_00285 [Euryarchaeota archaeon]
MDEDRGGRRGGYDRGPRQMYDAVCADCGQATQVPFKPDLPIRGSTRRRRLLRPGSGPRVPDVGSSSGEASRPRPTRADT